MTDQTRDELPIEDETTDDVQGHLNVFVGPEDTDSGSADMRGNLQH